MRPPRIAHGAGGNDTIGATNSYRRAQYRGMGPAGLRCRGCGVPVRLGSLGDICEQCWRWNTAQRLILRACQLLEGVR